MNVLQPVPHVGSHHNAHKVACTSQVGVFLCEKIAGEGKSLGQRAAIKFPVKFSQHDVVLQFFCARCAYSGTCSSFCEELIKVKQSHYSPRQALTVPGGSGSKISRQSAYKGGKVVSPTHRPPLPPGSIPGTHLC